MVVEIFGYISVVFVVDVLSEIILVDRVKKQRENRIGKE